MEKPLKTNDENINFLDLFDNVFKPTIGKVEFTNFMTLEKFMNYDPILIEEEVGIKSFYNTIHNTIKRFIEKGVNKITIYDDGRWLYIQNFRGKLWFDPKIGIFAGYFSKDFQFPPEWADNKTYTIKFNAPELKAIFIHRLLTDFPNVIEYKYIGGESYPNIKELVKKILESDEPLFLKIHRIRQAYELATSQASPQIATYSNEELKSILSQKNEDEIEDNKSEKEKTIGVITWIKDKLQKLQK